LSEELAARVTVHELNANIGFEGFTTALHQQIAHAGVGAYWVFDSLTDLQPAWYSDLIVQNFFRVTCPYLYELDTVAYFAMLRNRHTFATIAAIRETTQVLFDLHRVDDEHYIHPVKVFDRYSPTMYFPHRITNGEAVAITSSEASARLFAKLAHNLNPPDYWRVVVDQANDALLSGSSDAQEESRRLLLRMLVGADERMGELCKTYLTLADLLGIATREIGTGLVGGKTVGMLVARAILATEPERFDYLEAHDSFYLGADLFYTYIVNNGWWRIRTAQRTPEQYFTAGAELHELLGTGRFPEPVREQFRQMLEHFGQSPIIVRSSSLLEDNYGNAFAGKYDSMFCANQGTPEERLAAFENAVRVVYASSMSPDALAYRRDRGLADSDEQMAVLVQRVSGDHHGTLFFPHAAGVGNSSNLYVYDPSIDSTAGMVRLVVGLGTRAVDRTVQDYARIVALDKPTRRWLADPADLGRFSQHNADVLCLPTNSLRTIPMAELAEMDIGTDWSLFISPDHETIRRLRELGARRPGTRNPRVVDFDTLLCRTPVPTMLREMLACLSAAYDYPVDVEFTLNFTAAGQPRLNLVQCRPLQTRGLGPAVPMPTPDRVHNPVIQLNNGGFMGGNVRLPLEFVVMVRPEAYLAMGSQDRHAVARLIGELNQVLPDGRFMLVGPGRWGTSTQSLGIPVRFTEVNHAGVLCEITYSAGGFLPELSYGSHFFQDLVESGCFYLAVFDERPGVEFNPSLILDRPNELLDLVPTAGSLADAVHVAWFEHLVLWSDIDSQRAVLAELGPGTPAQSARA
ncbi:MAG: pyruvate kinase, partial [Propionibacterium sp.]|nr:pyruvate kinase [Propionibacterium sp.]